MRGKLLAAVVSVLVGIAVGVPTVQGAGGKRLYRCLGDANADGGTDLTIHNLSSKTANVKYKIFSALGVITDSGALDIFPRATVGIDFAPPRVLIELRTVERLLVDGRSTFLSGADPDQPRQIRCTGAS
ncbi:MAG: hypothetical protein WD826_02135 [Actinomycetota bacterium]